MTHSPQGDEMTAHLAPGALVAGGLAPGGPCDARNAALPRDAAAGGPA